MSTIAPERTDSLTEEEEALLHDLDPDHVPGCDVHECGRPAAFKIACTRCGTGGLICARHALATILELETRGVLHLPDGCDVCGIEFCTHNWRAFICFTPIGAGTS